MLTLVGFAGISVKHNAFIIFDQLSQVVHLDKAKGILELFEAILTILEKSLDLFLQGQ